MLRELYYGVSEQGKAAKHRMEDARALFSAARWRCTTYIAGYSIECLLKTKLMRMFGCRHLLELEENLQGRSLLSGRATVFTHELLHLLRLAQAEERLRRDASVWKEFNLVNRWVPAWRYTADLANRDDAEDFLQAVETIARWIENNV